MAFQSTRPARGATDHLVRQLSKLFNFNPRAPRGARQPNMKRKSTTMRFQSTRPARGATQYAGDGLRRVNISIHAPREGRDYKADRLSQRRSHFNPRAPRGARLQSFSGLTA